MNALVALKLNKKIKIKIQFSVYSATGKEHSGNNIPLEADI